MSSKITTKNLCCSNKWHVNETGLYYFGKRCIMLSRITGYFPFRQLEDHKLEFRWFSCPVAYLIFTFLYGCLVSLLAYPMFKNFMKSLVTHSLTTTDHITYGILSFSFFVGSFFLRIESLWNHKKVLAFWEKLDQSFQVLLNSAAQSLPPKQYEKTIEDIHCTVSGLALKVIVGIVLYEILLLATLAPIMVRWMGFSTRSLFLVASMFLWNFYTLGYISTSVLLNFLIAVMDKAFEILDMQALMGDNPEHCRSLETPVWDIAILPESLQTPTKRREGKIRKEIAMFLHFDELVMEFNETFGNKLVLQLIMFFINFTANTFFIVTRLGLGVKTGRADYINTLLSSPPTLIYLVVVVTLCSRATTLSQNASKCIKHFKKNLGMVSGESNKKLGSVFTVPPTITASNFFHVNRQLLTSIVCAATTYTIVLLQFRADDGRDVSGSIVRDIYNATSQDNASS